MLGGYEHHPSYEGIGVASTDDPRTTKCKDKRNLSPKKSKRSYEVTLHVGFQIPYLSGDLRDFRPNTLPFWQISIDIQPEIPGKPTGDSPTQPTKDPPPSHLKFVPQV